MTPTAHTQFVIDTLTTKLDQLLDFARANLVQDGDSEDDCQLVGILNRAGALQSCINGISDADVAPQAPESELITEALATANRAYCGDFDDLRINELRPHGVRGDMLADFVATEIREVLTGEDDIGHAVEAMQRAAETLQRVADALDPHSFL